VPLATFANNEGLVDVGGNLFQVGPNSGTAVITAPKSLGAGRIVGGRSTLSNVDLSNEFIGLIQASTGYSASSRVIQTCNDLFQQLLVLAVDPGARTAPADRTPASSPPFRALR